MLAPHDDTRSRARPCNRRRADAIEGVWHCSSGCSGFAVRGLVICGLLFLIFRVHPFLLVFRFCCGMDWNARSTRTLVKTVFDTLAVISIITAAYTLSQVCAKTLFWEHVRPAFDKTAYGTGRGPGPGGVTWRGWCASGTGARRSRSTAALSACTAEKVHHALHPSNPPQSTQIMPK